MPSLELTGAYRRSSGFVRLSALRYKSSKKLAHLPVSRRPPAFPDHIFRSLPPPLTIPTLKFFSLSICLVEGHLLLKMFVMNIIANSSLNKKRTSAKYVTQQTRLYDKETCIRIVLNEYER